MPGVAQVWLTQEELDALVLAAPNKGTRVSDGLWKNIGTKLTAARDALGCPVPDVRPDAAGLKVLSLRGTADDRPVTWLVCQ